MERPKWHQPSRYQMPFDFSQQPLEAPASEVLRFTYAVHEEVQVLSPHDAGAYLLSHVFTPFEAFTQEEVWVLSLNNKHRITHQSLVYRGTINTTSIRIGELFRPPLKLNAAAMLLAHVHPSGDPEPSQQDITVTQQVYDAGKLLEVELVDHLIVGKSQWVSLRSRGVGFDSSCT